MLEPRPSELQGEPLAALRVGTHNYDVTAAAR
jgi:hypothetical protein